MEALSQDQATLAPPPDAPEQQQQQQQPLSKNARKRILKQQRYEAKKAEKKAQLKEHKKREAERRRREWQEALESATEEERSKLIESRRERRRERVEKRSEERETKLRRLEAARASGQKVVIDLEFAHLMSANEINSLCQQIMYCYAMNGRCAYPCHLWLTGCRGEMGSQLRRIPGFDKWVVEMEDRSYVEALQDQKENLVYLTADSENVLDVLDQKRIYIIGGLVDRNRWKGLTMKKAEEQGIQTAKLPIGNYLKMSSSQVLTVNQVVEILLKFLETKDWKESFFHVIPQRKRCEADSIESQGNAEEEENVEDNQGEAKEEENVENNQSESNKERVEVPPPN